MSKAEKTRERAIRFNKRWLMDQFKKRANKGYSNYDVKWLDRGVPQSGLKEWLEQEGYTVIESWDDKGVLNWGISWAMADSTEKNFYQRDGAPADSSLYWNKSRP